MTVHKDFDDILTSIEFQNAESILDVFGEIGPLDPNEDMEPIDNDEALEALLSACGL